MRRRYVIIIPRLSSRFAKELIFALELQNGYSKTPVAFIQVPQLPKGALVEWQFAVHTGRRVTPVIHDDEEIPVTCKHDQCEFGRTSVVKT
jgi:hypothetical protein